MGDSRPVVAVDGPSGAGKSTVARMLAARLGYIYIDTGAMYRTVALAAVRASVALDDAAGLAALCRGLPLRLTLSPAGSRVLLGAEDVSAAIRTPEMSLASSRVSAVPSVREAMVLLQRKMGEQGGVVLEGRDIGTVVFPEAQAKFFVTASLDERARRRWEELRDKGGDEPLDKVREEMAARDRADSSRAHSPLRPAADAVEVDTTGLTPAQVVETMAARVATIEGREGNPVRDVVLAKSAGFCFGVKRAVELATKALAEGPHPVHTLGPIIHNPIEVARLETMGLRVAASLDELSSGTVIIRSHGVPRGVIEQAEAKGLRVVDATCPFVRKVEERVRLLAAEGYFVVICGDADHPEVEALVSWAPDRSLVAGGPGELAGVTLPHKVGVVAQTTQSMAALKAVAGACFDLATEVRVFRTNCHSTVRMRDEARKIAGEVDVMVVAGGKNSANTRRLAESTRALGKPTFLVEDAAEAAALPIPPDARVGLTAGASTPPWLLTQVAEALRKA